MAIIFDKVYVVKVDTWYEMDSDSENSCGYHSVDYPEREKEREYFTNLEQAEAFLKWRGFTHSDNAEIERDNRTGFLTLLECKSKPDGYPKVSRLRSI